MFNRIRKSKSVKFISFYLILSILMEIVYPLQALALTGGPSQPEFQSFSPIGTNDMVDLSSGDMSYNIPLMDVGGYPITLGYNSEITTDQEASWTGLGWNVSVGQINRNVRGLPDDFSGDAMVYENNLRENITVGADYKFQPGVLGLEGFEPTPGNFGFTLQYNNYDGFTFKQSVGINMELPNNASVGFNVTNGPGGMVVSPNASLHSKVSVKNSRNMKVTSSVGCSYGSRQGLTNATIGVSAKNSSVRYWDKQKGKLGDQQKAGNNGASVGSSISFAANEYTPTKRVGMMTGSFTFNGALGTEFFGFEGQGEITAYGTIQKVRNEESFKVVRAYGYQHTQSADKYSVLDFNREKDGAISSNSTNLPLTNYSYDIYSIQGQGVGGVYRPYRNEIGYVYDAEVKDASYSGSLGMEYGIGNAAHTGIDLDLTVVDSRSGVWDNNNEMYQLMNSAYTTGALYENVHFRNVGEISVDEEITSLPSSTYYRTGSAQATRVDIVGGKFHRKAIAEFDQKYNPQGNEYSLSQSSRIVRAKRQARNQAIHHLTLAEVKKGFGYSPLGNSSTYSDSYASINGLSGASKHTGEIQVIRNDGARYIYGLPAYNSTKKEATFAVSSSGNCSNGLVSYTSGGTYPDNSADNKNNDQYFNRVTTPAYAHAYLLTSILSTDYSDLTGDGPSADDLGSYTKFTYKRKDGAYKWRIPFQKDKASYNEGLRTNKKDDQGSYVYGEKEIYLIEKIETKTHVAIFSVTPRHDAHGVLGENGGLDVNENSYKLDKISLYAKPEFDINQSAAIPIKTVFFEYDYSLCPSIENNDGDAEWVNSVNLNAGKGKLTLKKIYFNYRGSNLGKYSAYKFNYLNPNPSYNLKAYDSWGNYMQNSDNCSNEGNPNALESPYTPQDKIVQNANARAWKLSSIDLPSGGTISVNYESDDYTSVQNKDALRMYQLAGVGLLPNPGPADIKKALYSDETGKTPNPFVYVKLGSVTDPFISSLNTKTTDELRNIFMDGMGDKMFFRCLTNMDTYGGYWNSLTDGVGADYISGYVRKGTNISTFDMNGTRYLSMRLEMVDRGSGDYGASNSNDVHPFTMAAWFFGRKYLNKYVYSDLPDPDAQGSQIASLIVQLTSPQIISNLLETFTGPNAKLEQRNIGRLINPAKSWVRLKAVGNKLGGGSRVSSITMKDVWERMNGEQTEDPTTGYTTMNYTQKYSYTRKDGITSSGVASYEPIGNKENPFVQPVMITEKHILAPDEENYIELPMGESFFPSPSVTYARVTVESVEGGVNGTAGWTINKLHKTGKVVSEFYTSKDFPTLLDQTNLEAKEDKRELLSNILKLNVRKYLTASQGYVICLNDMDKKPKATWVFAEGQSTPISGVEYKYDAVTASNTSNLIDKAMDRNKVKVIYPNGDIREKTLGVEVDVVNDFMSNESTTITAGVDMNLGVFIAGIFPVVVPTAFPTMSTYRDKYRATSTTKVINIFGILKETIAYEDNASVSTKNLAWDALTGEVLLTETKDEFNDSYYSFNMPAHWYYKGMGQAASNLGLEGLLSGNSGNYKANNQSQRKFFFPGDELMVTNNSVTTRYWVTGVNSQAIQLVNSQNIQFTGSLVGATFKLVRSGYDNLQSAGIMNVTLMRNPLKSNAGVDLTNLGTNFLTGATWDVWKIIQAGAVDYSENWPASCECGTFTGSQNPYIYNKLGVWRTKSSRTYLTGRFSQANVSPRHDGFFTDFSPMYRLSFGNSWVKSFTNWTFVSEVSMFSPFGTEIENRDAISRYSAAQYGYNNSFPVAVGANTMYRQIGFDGMEDYNFGGCALNRHFGFFEFRSNGVDSDPTQSHTGKFSLRIPANGTATMLKTLVCPTNALP